MKRPRYDERISSGAAYATTGAATTTLHDTGVTNGTTYYYEVTAVNALGETVSPEGSVRPAGSPSAPDAPSATPGDAHVDLAWNAPADGGSPILGYHVYRGTAQGVRDRARSSTSARRPRVCPTRPR